MKKKVVVLLADGFEETEAVTTIDVLRRAELDVTIAGVGASPVKGAHGIAVTADTPVGAYKDSPDAVVIPGGVPGVDNLAASAEVNSLIRNSHEKGKLIAAICAAPSNVLAPAGILEGRKATCYPGCEKALKDNAEFVGEKVVVDGNLVTSRGPGTAFDFALKVVEILAGESVKEKVGKQTLHEPR